MAVRLCMLCGFSNAPQIVVTLQAYFFLSRRSAPPVLTRLPSCLTLMIQFQQIVGFSRNAECTPCLQRPDQLCRCIRLTFSVTTQNIATKLPLEMLQLRKWLRISPHFINLKINFRIHTSPPLDPVLRQMNPVSTLIHFPLTCFNIILPFWCIFSPFPILVMYFTVLRHSLYFYILNGRNENDHLRDCCKVTDET